jgi:hypothetical protein
MNTLSKTDLKKYQNWSFFDKFGNDLNFTYDEKLERWIGDIYFQEVSVGLIENEHIFILEKFIENSERDVFIPAEILGIPPGFGKYIFTIYPSDTFDDNTRFIWKNCDGSQLQYFRKNYITWTDFYDAILNGLKSVAGQSTSFRIDNTFYVIVELAQQPCIETRQVDTIVV